MNAPLNQHEEIQRIWSLSLDDNIMRAREMARDVYLERRNRREFGPDEITDGGGWKPEAIPFWQKHKRSQDRTVAPWDCGRQMMDVKAHPEALAECRDHLVRVGDVEMRNASRLSTLLWGMKTLAQGETEEAMKALIELENFVAEYYPKAKRALVEIPAPLSMPEIRRYARSACRDDEAMPNVWRMVVS